MDINSDIPAKKKIVSVEILHLDVMGYGPQGKHTRREWRQECLDNLLAGPDAFMAWQASWKDKINRSLHHVSLAIELTYNDGSQESVLGDEYIRIQPYVLDFVAQTFKKEVVARDLIFEEVAYFRNANFTEYTDFKGANFTGKADFDSTTFSGEADFYGVTFGGNVSFSKASFSKDAYFSNTVFVGNAFFEGCTFSNNSEFNDTMFREEVYFSNTIFSRDAEFNSAMFDGLVFFNNTIFHNGAYFNSTIFAEDTSFTLATFHTLCHFENWFNKREGKWSRETRFSGKIDFENAIFKNVGHFERVHFVNNTPAFRGCQIDSTRLEFSDDSYFPPNENSDDAVKNISFLKRLADEHGQTDQALNFNAMELRAKRKQVEPQAAHWSFKVVTWLYEKISDYGRSFLRPLLGYGALIVCSLLLTLPLTDYSQDTTPVAVANRALCIPKDKDEVAKLLQLTHGRAAFEYAMFRAGGVMDFTDTGKQNNTVNCTLFGQPIEPPGMRAWGIFKGIASIALLFLAALGLRNKYRIK